MAIRRRSHVDRINSYILVWPGDEREQIGFDGQVFHLPGIDEVAKPGDRSPFRYDSAVDRSGIPLPGTVRIADQYATIEGNRVKVFDADEFVRWIETVRHDYLDRGLVICDLPEEVEEAKAEGRPIWEASQDARARSMLEAELFRRKKFEDKGTPAPPSSSEHLVAWAIKHLNERGTALSLIPTEDIHAALSGAPTPPPPAGPRKAFVAERPAPMPAKAPVTGPGLYQQAKALGLKLKAAELDGLLSEDPAVVKDVEERVKEKQADVEAMATKVEGEGAAAQA